MEKRFIYTAILLLLVAVVGWFMFTPGKRPQPEDKSKQAYLQTNGHCLQLDVARTPAQKRQGLSGRRSLSEDEGMLFVYDQPGRYGFWMKDMNFPIDIIWLDEDDRVVIIKDNVSPDSFPKTFRPTKPAKNVVELASGTAQRLKIKSGDRLNLVAPTTTTPVGC